MRAVVLVTIGSIMILAGIAAYDWRAAVIAAGVVIVAAGMFADLGDFTE
jgi:hypothetical protein